MSNPTKPIKIKNKARFWNIKNGRKREKNKFAILSILLILMLLPLACAGPYTTYYKNRGQPVQPEPFWECEIDPDIWIPNINLVG